MLTIETIKARYPNPKTSKASSMDSENYCVGGACLSAALDDDIELMNVDSVKIMTQDDSARLFPTRSVLAHNLQIINPHLEEDFARRYADNITEQNDIGNFDAAWAHLANALKVE